MKAYLLRRVMQAIPTLLFISIVTFSIAMLLPGCHTSCDSLRQSG
jgi:ABC-type dipeptide/oligopeptide/nickel transport system permease component